MRKNSTVAKNGNRIFKQPALTIGLDLGDPSSCYFVLDELENVTLERSVQAKWNPPGVWQDAAQPARAGNERSPMITG
jgi:hypothetical protein